MNLLNTSLLLLENLAHFTKQLSDENYSKSSASLNGATLGQHIRHILEFFLSLEKGLKSGLVNYDDRQRNQTIELNKDVALEVMKNITTFLSSANQDQQVSLMVDYSLSGDHPLIIPSSYFRELAYNIEHTVHHMALIKIGANEIAPEIKLSEDFGVAKSTLRYHQSLQPFQ